MVEGRAEEHPLQRGGGIVHTAEEVWEVDEVWKFIYQCAKQIEVHSVEPHVVFAEALHLEYHHVRRQGVEQGVIPSGINKREQRIFRIGRMP